MPNEIKAKHYEQALEELEKFGADKAFSGQNAVLFVRIRAERLACAEDKESK